MVFKKYVRVGDNRSGENGGFLHTGFVAVQIHCTKTLCWEINRWFRTHIDTVCRCTVVF